MIDANQGSIARPRSLRVSSRMSRNCSVGWAARCLTSGRSFIIASEARRPAPHMVRIRLLNWKIIMGEGRAEIATTSRLSIICTIGRQAFMNKHHAASRWPGSTADTKGFMTCHDLAVFITSMSHSHCFMHARLSLSLYVLGADHIHAHGM